MNRIEAREKVTGRALYAYEYPVENVAYGFAVQARVARGRITAMDTSRALAVPGVLTVVTHENAPELYGDDDVLKILQSDRVAYRGRLIGVVVAETSEAAREAAGLIDVTYQVEPHDVLLRAVPSDIEEPPADVVIDETYTTPVEHNNPMEPHATTAVWTGDELTLYEATQGPTRARDSIATVLGLEPERVRVVAPHVGGGFGSKGTPRPNVILAALAARAAGRPVRLALTRQQMFDLTGYRSPTIQRMRLGADSSGRLSTIIHEVSVQSSTLNDFTEQAGAATGVMYAAPHRHVDHRLSRLDVGPPSWMRAPGEAPGMFALESAMDELAIACGIDPIELRVLNDTSVEPASGRRFSSRNLVACLREGAERFGWASRSASRSGRWLVGSGVAASTYPVIQSPSKASAQAVDNGFVVRIAAADIGTGARTALTRLAAATLEVPMDRVRVEIGDSALPAAPLAGGSMGTASWGTAVVRACEDLLKNGSHGEADTAEEVKARGDYARHSFGAQFAEVRVDPETGEVRVARLLGVFAAGHIVNPKTAHSQFIGAMTMGLSMALHEQTVIDAEFGGYTNADLAGYHVAAHADVPRIEAHWIDEDDPHLNPMGAKGIGEIGITGTAAAIANAVHHATGRRIRSLPITPSSFF